MERLFVLLLLLAGVTTAESSNEENDCKRHDNKIGHITVKCSIDVFGEYINVTASINYCHEPVDVSYQVNYQLDNGTKHHFEYTFVTTNGEENAFVPDLVFPNDKFADAPVYIHSEKIPANFINGENKDYLYIRASFVAQLPASSEVYTFLNHTLFIGNKDVCTTTKVQQNEGSILPWIIGGAVVSVVVLGVVVCIICWYRRHKISLDELALVSSLDAGISGAKPYQLGDSNITPSGPDVTEDRTDGETTHTSNETGSMSSPVPTTSTPIKSGGKGFRFGRLKEDPEEMRERAVAVCDKSTVIGNPINMRYTNGKKKRGPNIIVNNSTSSTSNLSNGANHSVVKENRMTNGVHSNSSTASPSDDSLNSYDGVKQNGSMSHPLQDKMEECERSSKGTKGARPKLRKSLSKDFESKRSSLATVS